MAPVLHDLLAALPRSPQGHFRLQAYLAIQRLIIRLERLLPAADGEAEPVCERFPFLAEYQRELARYAPEALRGEAAVAWWEEQLEVYAAECQGVLPLRTLAAGAGIGPAALTALLLIGMVEEDSRFGLLYTQLQPALSLHRPCLELVGRLVGDFDEVSGLDAWSICRPLFSAGLLDVTSREVPRSEWELSVPPVLWDVLRGDGDALDLSWCRHTPVHALPALTALILPEDVLRRLAQVPAVIRSGKAGAIVLRGMKGSERFEAMGAVARTLGFGVIAVEAAALEVERQRERLGPLCLLTGSLLVITYELGLGESVQLPELPGYHWPVGILIGPEGGLKGDRAGRAVTVPLPLPNAELRRRYWEQGLAGHPAPDLAEVSARFQMPGGYIRQAAALAIANAGLERREAVQTGDIRQACRFLNRQALDSLAIRLEAGGTWDDLVVSEPVAARLRELERRCRHRERLLEYLSPAYRSGTNRGVRALFGGPSGTGKTLAAKILAAVLDMDIYRVDLAAVVNKYIGETEKNLNQVFARAEELDVVLLLDEGDSLLAKRSDVKSSNDRYANMETNYLLQRLEGYQGIVVVTTNAAEAIDKAFQRRMDVSVDFQPPQPEERLHIWELHLPPGHTAGRAFLEEVASRCALTGGQIRNAALHATLLSLDAGGVVTARVLEEAIQSEYKKAGAICPL